MAEPAALAPSPPSKPASGHDAHRQKVSAFGQLGPGDNKLFIDVAAPEGAKLTSDSPLSVRGSGGIGVTFPRALSGSLGSHSIPLELPIVVSDGATGPIEIELTYHWCSDGTAAACHRERAVLSVELDLTGSASGGEAYLSYRARG